MFKTKFSKPMFCKLGRIIAEGTECSVEMIPGSLTHAIISIPNEIGIRIQVVKLHEFFSEFIRPDILELEEDYLETNTTKSLTGKTVEADGYDSDGFPSCLMTLGYV